MLALVDLDKILALGSINISSLNLRENLRHIIITTYQKYQPQDADKEVTQLRASYFASLTLGTYDYLLEYKSVPSAQSVLNAISSIIPKES